MTTPRLDIPGWEHLPRPDLHGSTVVLTGGSDGIGREAALRLAHWGARLVLPVRTRDRTPAVVKLVCPGVPGEDEEEHEALAPAIAHQAPEHQGDHHAQGRRRRDDPRRDARRVSA